ncbi:MAG TPA: twin-arginine translocase TatA/TatE family subunit [Vicinamibacterales bacterium]|nr:twin-arginine translocase TatA/TatE family subunit [Vicinamibacterales bacterium]
MFGSVGMPELLIIMVIALMIFGPRRLPELGRAVGQTLNEFKKGTKDLGSTIEQDARREPPPAPAQAAQAPPAQTPSVPGTESRRA